MIRLLLVLAGVCGLLGAAGLWGAASGESAALGRASWLLVPLQRHRGTRWFDHALGLGLALAFTAVVLASAHDLGFMRDEGMYFDASKSYAGWFERLLSASPAVRATAFERGAIDAHWAPNAEHPSLMKSAFALSWIYFWKTWPQGLVELLGRSVWTAPLAALVSLIGHWCPQLFVEESASFRFPGMLAGGLVLYVTYLFGAEALGRVGGLIAAVLQAMLPRPFFDAHLAGFDAAAALVWVGVAYCYWKGLKSSGWAMVAGLAWGVSLLTKHNSWFLPVVFLLHWLWLAADVLRPRPTVPVGVWARLRMLPIPWPFLFMGMFGPAIFVAGWPRLWFDTWARIEWYFAFHAHHDFYNIEYLGTTWFRPPMPVSMPYLLVLATVPLATLVAMVVGVLSSARQIFRPVLSDAWGRLDDPRRTRFFWFMNMNLPVALIAHPSVPHFGGTKHWHSAYPFLCLFAAAGVLWAGSHVVSSLKALLDTSGASGASGAGRSSLAPAPAPRWIAMAALTIGALVMVPGLVETYRSHPHGLSHYTPIVGGAPGAADLGLNRGFWGYETGAITEWLNTHLPRGGRVYPNDTFYSSWEQLRADQRLRRDIEAEWSDANSCDLAVIEHEQHMDEVEHQIWVAFGTVTPVHVVTLDGVPLLTVYANPRSTRFVP